MKTYTEKEIQLIKSSLENMKQDISKIKHEDLNQDDVNELFFLINTLREEYHNEIRTKFKSFKTFLLEKLTPELLVEDIDLLIKTSEKLYEILLARIVS